MPPDFYSLEAVARRIGLASLNEHGLVELVDNVFTSLENHEMKDLDRLEFSSRELTDADIPPPDSHEDRTKLFIAYSGVVDRLLENPPASLSREELSSLISFTRMVPANTASRYS